MKDLSKPAWKQRRDGNCPKKQGTKQDSIYYEDGVLVHNTDIKVKKSDKTKIKINLCAKPGKY